MEKKYRVDDSDMYFFQKEKEKAIKEKKQKATNTKKNKPKK